MTKFLTLLVFTAVLFSCGDKEKTKEYVHIPPELPTAIYDKVQDGDFILRQGNGPLSYHIMNSTEEEYSHCGIIVEENGKKRVIHSMGGSVSRQEEDGVQIMDLEKFVAHAADSMLFICRPIFQEGIGKEIKDEAYKHLANKTPFDHSFDVIHRDKIFCSELMFHILRDITGRNQMRVRKQHKSYILLFSTFFDETRYDRIFQLKEGF